MLDVRLPDGSRVNAVIPPLAVGGPSLTIRRFSSAPPELEDLIHFNILTPEMGEVLRALVRARCSVLVSGPSGSGKTTLLNVLARFIPDGDRIVTVEDAAELRLPQRHVVRLEARPPDGRGLGGVTLRDLVRNALRMRPNRLVVGDLRGAESLELLQAANSGHEGLLAAIHGESPADALRRLETLAVMAGLGVAGASLRRYVSSAISVIVHVARLADGARRVSAIHEVAGVEGGEYGLTEVFAFEETGVDERGNVRGRFRASGVRPRFVDRCEALGAPIPRHVFDPLRAVEL